MTYPGLRRRLYTSVDVYRSVDENVDDLPWSIDIDVLSGNESVAVVCAQKVLFAQVVAARTISNTI